MTDQQTQQPRDPLALRIEAETELQRAGAMAALLATAEGRVAFMQLDDAQQASVLVEQDERLSRALELLNQLEN